MPGAGVGGRGDANFMDCLHPKFGELGLSVCTNRGAESAEKVGTTRENGFFSVGVESADFTYRELALVFSKIIMFTCCFGP